MMKMNYHRKQRNLKRDPLIRALDERLIVIKIGHIV